jgi:hypothetical protein
MDNEFDNGLVFESRGLRNVLDLNQGQREGQQYVDWHVGRRRNFNIYALHAINYDNF